MFLVLDRRLLIHNQEVDCFSCRILFETALSTCVKINFGIESSLRYFHDSCKSLNRFLGSRGIQILNHAIDGRIDKQITGCKVCLCIFNLSSGCSKRRKRCFSIRKSCCHSCYSCNGRIASKTVSIKLRNHFGTKELSGQSSKRNTCSLNIVHCVNGKHSATIISTFFGFVFQGYVTCNITSLFVVICQTLHRHFRDQDLICICSLSDQLVRTIQNRCK